MIARWKLTSALAVGLTALGAGGAVAKTAPGAPLDMHGTPQAATNHADGSIVVAGNSSSNSSRTARPT